jgi:hypothetical protein
MDHVWLIYLVKNGDVSLFVVCLPEGMVMK